MSERLKRKFTAMICSVQFSQMKGGVNSYVLGMRIGQNSNSNSVQTESSALSGVHTDTGFSHVN